MATPLNLLIVEDVPDDADLLLAELCRAGFDPKWKRVQTEPDFLAEIEKLPDLIISDYSMPQFSGLRAAELLLASGLDIPFILISGTVGEEIAVEAMQHGASDYLLKDRLSRLGSAVQRALRESRERAELKLVQTALHESEQRFSLFMNHSPAAAWIVDAAGKFYFVSPGYYRMFGNLAGDLAGKNIREIYPPDLAREYVANNLIALNEGRVVETVESGFRPDGSKGQFLVVKFPMPAEGNDCLLGGIALDVTASRQAEQKIREQLDELLRWQGVMLNREDRLLALKAEVNELLAQLRQPARYTSPSKP